MIQYVKICEDESGSGAVEVPSEPDGTLLLSTIQAQCPGACGLRYKNEQSWRGVRLADNVLYPPFEDGWGNIQFVVVPSKTGELEKVFYWSSLNIKVKITFFHC